MSTTAVAPPTADEALQWEARQRPRTGIAAVLAGFLAIAAFIASTVAFTDSPNVTATDALRDAVNGNRPLGDGRVGLLTQEARWYDDNRFELVGVIAAAGLSVVLLAFVLGYLFRATKARRPEFPRFFLYLALIGPILYGIGPVVLYVSVVTRARDYVGDGVFSTVGAHHALRDGGGLAVGAGFRDLGQLATAVAVVMLCLNAMRVGLLTRFLGILGSIVGLFLLFARDPLGSHNLVQSFWLVAVGLVILQRIPNLPPAWVTGEAVPWETQQQRQERLSADAEEEPPPVSSAPQRRKRKRR